MATRSHSLKVITSIALVVTTCAGLASCGGGSRPLGDQIPMEPAAPQGTPDLVVESPSVIDSSPAARAQFTLSVTVQNDGDGASAATTLRYYRSTNKTIATSDTAVGMDVVGSLSVSGSSAETLALIAPSMPGTYHYGACVDAVAGESDTTNNCSTSVSVIVDDEEEPTLTLILTPDSISENGASTTVSAKLRHASSAPTTITVSAAPVSPALVADFELSANTNLRIDAGATTSTKTVTITAVNNSVDAPDKEVSVSASATNTQGVTAPADLTLTIEDDEQAPTAVLHLSSSSIGENSGSSTVTAELSHPSSVETTLTVSATAGANKVPGDFELSANTTLTIDAGAATSTGTVTIDAVNNGVDAPNKKVTVSADAVNTQGVTAPADVTLTIIDDEEEPTVTLILTPDSIDEDSGSSTVTATLSHASIQETTLIVSATAGTNASDGDFTLSNNTTLTIDAGTTTSTGTVTIEAVNNSADGPNKEVTVSAGASNAAGVSGPADVTLTITDDEGEPTVMLILTPDSIDENSGSSTVTATLSHASSEETTLTVSAAAGVNATDGDFTLSDNTTLTIDAGTTTSTGTVTIEAVNNSADGPNKEVTVSAVAANAAGVSGPANVTLTITDDEGEPTVMLILTPDSIDENSGSSTVTATLSHASGQETTLTVSAAAGVNATDGDFTLSDNTTLTIDAGTTTSTGTVTIEAVNNSADGPNKEVTVSAGAANAAGVSGPANVTLTIIDDEGEPTVMLILTPDSIDENSGSSTVTATLSHASSEETTLTVSAAAGVNATDGDFTLSDNTTLTIDAGTTTSTGTVTIEAVDSSADGPNKEVTVSAVAANASGVSGPANVTLTITDDEGEPTVMLILTSDSIDENSGSSTVTATLSHASGQETTLTVSAAAGVNATDGDFTLSDNTTLTIDAGTTTSTGTVTIEAVNNSADGPNKEVTVSAVAANAAGVSGPANVTLTIIDDEGEPTVMLILTPDSIDENSGSSTVTATLSHASSEETTLTVSAAAGANAADGDFTLSDNTTLTIDAGDTTSTGTVTIEAVNNSADEPDKEVTASAVAANTQGVTAPEDVTLTITDDEAASTQSSPSISITLSPGHQVPMNTAITATISLINLDVASYSSVMFRADLTAFSNREQRCDGEDTGKDIEIPVDESKEVFTVQIYAACPYYTYSLYKLVARVFTVDSRTKLASATTNFLMSRYLSTGETAPMPPAPGVEGWLDPAPPPVMYVGEWHRFQVRADVRLYFNDHISVHAYGNELYRWTSSGAASPSHSIEDACLDPDQESVVRWRRAIHQAFHIAACRPGTAVISVKHITEAVDSLYSYDVQILPARTADEALTREVSTSTPTLSVADARAHEGVDASINFAVTLDQATSRQVTVDYATANGSATAGADYTATNGTLTFASGDTSKTVRVPVLDDAVDEGAETLTLRLSNASGARSADKTATGTIENSGPLQKMWLSRFGRTVTSHVVDAVAGRLSGASGVSQVTLGGKNIDLSALSVGASDARLALGVKRAAEDNEPRSGPTARPAQAGFTSRTLTGRELLLGSSFNLVAGGGEVGDPGFAVWGRVTTRSFDAAAPAEKGKVRLDGKVTTGVLGVDATWERWLAGVALSVSGWGEYKFDQPGVDSRTIESTLTSVNPYVRYEVSERVSAWGMLGYGTGDMTMTQAARGARTKTVTRTGLTMRFGATGARGALLEAGESGGIDLALRGDAFLVQMESAAAANMVNTEADASRLRLVLEGSRAFALGEGAALTVGLEVGLRHDGGDAETGAGVEVGGRISYTDTDSGLTVEGSARTLIAHEDSCYREWGAGGSVRLDPGASGRGLSLTLAPGWGTPSSGVERLWAARDAAGLVPGGEFETTWHLNAELGYGLGAPRGLGLVTPYAGLSLAEGGGRTRRTGARWQVAPDVTLGIEGTHNEAANDDEPPQHGLMLRCAIRW